MAEDPAAEETIPKPRRKMFRPSAGSIPFDRASAERQSKAAISAWEALGGREAATAFLNSHNDKLGGRPIDLAIGSADGLAAVERELSRLKGDA